MTNQRMLLNLKIWGLFRRKKLRVTANYLDITFKLHVHDTDVKVCSIAKNRVPPVLVL